MFLISEISPVLMIISDCSTYLQIALRIHIKTEFLAIIPHLKYLIHVEESRRVKKKHGGRAEFAFNLCKIKHTFSVIVEKTKPV